MAVPGHWKRHLPLLTRYRVGSGWQGYNAVTSMTALRADAVGDIVAREPSGVLWYYRASGNPSAPFLKRLEVGKGWQIYNQLPAPGTSPVTEQPI